MIKPFKLIAIVAFNVLICSTLQANKGYMQELMIKGRSQYLCGDLENARATFNEILCHKPNEVCANRFLMLTNERLREIQEHQRRAVKHDMLSEVSDSWQRPVIFEEDQQPEKEHIVQSIDKKLQSIQIPSVDFKGAPLSSVIRMLSELSVQYDTEEGNEKHRGVNMVVLDLEAKDPNVTLALRNVSLKQVLEFVVKSVGFRYDIEDNIIAIRPRDDYIADLETEFFPISRATVIRMTGNRNPQYLREGMELYKTSNPAQFEEEIALRLFLQRAGIPFDSDLGAPRDADFAFDGTHLIVTHTRRNLKKINNILARYKDMHQVEIEAKFMEVQQGVLEELGFRWSATSKSKPDKRFFQTSKGDVNDLRSLADAFSTSGSSTGNGQVIRSAASDVNIVNKAPVFPNTINIGANSVPVGGILSVLDNWDIGLIIDALEQHTGADLMSAPKVTVLSGKTARITVAQVLRYPEAFGDIQSAVGTAGADAKNSSAGVTITAGTPKDFAEKNVGVEMEVTPTVENGGKDVSLKLEPRVTEFEGFVEYGGRSVAISGDTTVDVPSGFFQPIFSTREIPTEVTICDGSTVVMGGLTREEIKQIKDKVPILGDLPGIGKIFRSKGETNQKKNLLIFVTANVINEGGALANQRLWGVPPNSAYKNACKITPSGIAKRLNNR